jgi:ribosomal protein S18 acetylase RimI-like enzyme
MTQLASIPGTIRALYRRPAALKVGTSYLNAIVKAHLKGEHWYLYLLVADPEYQRRGVGAMLLNDRIGEIDEQGLPAYLETQKTDNIAYYRRFGFELDQTLTPVPNGPPIYTMRRAAR